MKSEIPHWIKHYEPKGKFDDVLVDGGNLLTSLGDGKFKERRKRYGNN